MPDAAVVSVRYKLEQTIWTRVKREILQGKYVERHLHEAALVALAETFVAKLADMQQALPLELDGLDAGEIEKRLNTRFDEARQAIVERRDIELHAAAHGPGPDEQPKAGRPPASSKPPRQRSRPVSPFKIAGKPRSKIAKR